jgi:hypothetical protein
MWKAGPEFAREDAVPKDVLEYFSKYEIRLTGSGILAGEACVFLFLDPNVTILAHQRVPDSHPEATTHFWAARIKVPGGDTYRALYAWNGSFLFLLVRSSWSALPPTYVELLQRARDVEAGSTPAPDLSLARVEYERFTAKHREVTGPRGVAKTSADLSSLKSRERNEMRLLREYRRLATTCMERLERIPG